MFQLYLQMRFTRWEILRTQVIWRHHGLDGKKASPERKAFGFKEMAQRAKYLLCKCEDLSSNPQSPCVKAGWSSIHLQPQCSYGEVRSRKTGNSPEALGPASQEYTAANDKRGAVSKVMETEDWHLRLSSEFHKCHNTGTLAHNTCIIRTQNREPTQNKGFCEDILLSGVVQSSRSSSAVVLFGASRRHLSD